MAKFDVLDMNGKKVSTIELSDAVFGMTPNEKVMHAAVVNFLANQRQGTQSTKTRSEVSGGGKKPWRQKGTGRARQGTIRAPQWAGGGVVFGPHPRSYDIKVNRKEVKLAMRSALSAKLADGEFHVVSEFGFEKPRTKDAVAVLKALDLEDRRITIVVDDEDVNAYLSFRNIPKVNVIPATEINTYELIDNKALVVTQAALAHIEEVLA